MKTYYDPRRTCFHNIRFSGVEEERLQERRKKFRFESVSDFIRTAVLDDEIKVVTEVYQSPPPASGRDTCHTTVPTQARASAPMNTQMMRGGTIRQFR